ncbi:Hypothetical protein A7982_04617 [Minicystis rosea]|nr:Hypothetical protein A7982_04617 [Minicystis rosea]
MLKRPLFALSFFAVALAGCPGSLENPERFAEQFGTCPDVPTLLNTACGTANCHGASNPSSGLDLASSDIAGRLAGKEATNGGLLLDFDAPEKSVLYTKVTDLPPFGSRMPLGGTPFDDTEVSCILSWIETSAKGGSP